MEEKERLHLIWKINSIVQNIEQLEKKLNPLYNQVTNEVYKLDDTESLKGLMNRSHSNFVQIACKERIDQLKG